jgi:multidrug efflux pump subunit AcrA (membrane-fusion protein)
MQATQPPRADLRTLSRGGDAFESSPAPRPTATTSSTVPPPRFNYKTRIFLPGGILLALLLLMGYAARDSLLPAREVTVVPVVLKDVATTSAPTSARAGNSSAAAGAGVQAPGWVEADPFPISVTALTDGVVKEMLALEGQQIRAGDVVARLVDDDAKLALAKAEAELAEKQAALEAAQRQWDHPIESTRAVATGEAMVNASKSQLDKLEAEIAVESAKLTQAKEEFARTEQATTQRALSEIDLIRARQQHQAQQATLAAVTAQKRVIAAELAQREAELIAARENLRLRIQDAKMLAEAKAAVNLTTAARDEAALRLSRMEVRAQTDGIVMQRHVTPGSKVMFAGDNELSASVVHLYDPKKLQVRVDIPLADAAKVGVDQPAQVVVGVLPNQTFSGRVTRIVNEADIQKNTLQVKVAIDNPSPQLKPEMLARVRFVGAAPTAMATATDSNATATTRPRAAAQAIFAPAKLILRHGEHAITYVADRGRNVAARKTVQLGEAQIDGWVEITAGLNVGDALIVEQDGLRDGQRIRVTGEANESLVSGAGTDAQSKGNDHAAH